MKVIFLSAGLGVRMMPYTKDLPKPLLQIDPENTVLDIQLKKLRNTPVEEVVIVAGYYAKKIEHHAKKYYPDMDIKVVYNPFYDVSNNFVSLWTARHNMDEPFIVINGDNLFQSSVINGLIKNTRGKECVMVVDKKAKYDKDDMKVQLKGRKVKAVAKTLKRADASSIGMMKFEKGGIRKLKKIMDTMIHQKKYRNVFWLKAVQEMIDQHNNVEAHVIRRDQWEEIDFHGEYSTLIKGDHKRFYFQRENKQLRRIPKKPIISHPVVRHVRKEFRKLGRVLRGR